MTKLVAATLVAFCTPGFGQNAAPASPKTGGFVTDWSTHHVVFSNPGPESDAVKSGHYTEWLKIVAEPRYVMQQQKRGSTVLQPTLVAPKGISNSFGLGGRFGREPWFRNPGGIEGRSKNNVSLNKDWSMNNGAAPSAGLTITVANAPGSGTVSNTSTITVDGQTFTGSAPTSASQTGTFSGNPTTGQTVAVGGLTIAASDSTASSQKGTFSSPPTTANAITVVNGVNTFTATTNGVAQVWTLTFSGDNTTGSAVFTYSGGSASNVLTMTPGATNTCSSATAGTWVSSTTASTQATNFVTAITSCHTSFPAIGFTATHTSGSSSAVITADLPGNFLAATETLTAGALANTNAGSNGSATCTSATTGHYATSNSVVTLASDVAAMFEACSAANAATIGVNPSAGTITLDGSGGVTVQADKWGATPGVTLTPTATGFFKWTAGTMSGGTNGTTDATHFTVDNVNADNAAALTTSITTANNGVVTATHTAGSTSLTASAVTPGTGGNGSGALSSGATGFAWGGGTFAGGSDGTTSATAFKYWTTNTYDTQNQMATDLAAAFAANATLTSAVSAAASTNTVVLTAFHGGSAGNSFTAATGTGTHTFTALTIPNSGDFSGGADVALPNTYPAKYSFSTSTASCSDYVVYPTGQSSTNATIIAYNNIYVTTCSGTVPTVAWAYNTGGTAVLSPILSADGTEVAYIQTSSNVASLVLLKPSSISGGTVSAPATASLVALGSYPTCTAPCYTTITLSGSPNDTNSSPYYDYNTDGGDILWVGDDSGSLHEFTGVFSGTPAENLTNWPITVDSGAVLTSPVWESLSGNIFVADSAGKLSYVTTASTPTVTSSVGLTAAGSNGIVDAPLIDEVPAAPLVYAFVGDSTASTALVEQFSTSFASGASATATSRVSSVSGSSTAAVLYSGTFDNLHYDIGGTGGFMWVCGANSTFTVPALTRITMSTFATAGTQEDTITSAAATCSPIVEFLGAKVNTTLGAAITTAIQTAITVTSGTGIVNGDYLQLGTELMHVTAGGGTTSLTVTRGQQGTTAGASYTVGTAAQDIQDWIYLSVAANGADTGCTGACLYNYNVTTTTSPTGSTDGIATTGGASGVVVDNSLTGTGDSQIYYSTLGNQVCAGSGGVGTGTGSCAVQTSQSAP